MCLGNNQRLVQFLVVQKKRLFLSLNLLQFCFECDNEPRYGHILIFANMEIDNGEKIKHIFFANVNYLNS